MNENQDPEKVQQQVQQLELIVRQRLTSDALSRFGNIKAANPELAIQLMVYLGQLIQGGKINMIDDQTLKLTLQKISVPKKEFNITRR
mgnify:CR=1 FL=1